MTSSRHGTAGSKRWNQSTSEWRALDSFDLSERAALAIEEAEQAWFDLVKRHLMDDLRGQVALASALNNAVLAAFFQAKHESRTAEDRAQRVAEGAQKARAKAKAKDNRIAYAREIWSAEPALSLPKVARKVLEKLYWQDDQELISDQAMKDSLSRAVDRGDLTVPSESPDYHAR